MPITCPINIAPISQPEMAALNYEVMRHVFAAHNEFGCLCDESVYHARLVHLLTRAAVQAESEVPVTLRFRDFVKTLYLDLVVNRQAIYELKTVSSLTPAHVTQLLNYLFLTEAERGKLVNFRPSSVESTFVNAAMSGAERRDFSVESPDWSGPDDFRQMVSELVLDWGTGLDRALYHQAVAHCLGGEEVVTVQLPMQVEGVPLGNQRFHLLREGEGFQFTTFTEGLGTGQVQHIKKLVAPSPLRAMHCVNIGRHLLSFRTIKI